MCFNWEVAAPHSTWRSSPDDAGEFLVAGSTRWTIREKYGSFKFTEKTDVCGGQVVRHVGAFGADAATGEVAGVTLTVGRSKLTTPAAQKPP